MCLIRTKKAISSQQKDTRDPPVFKPFRQLGKKKDALPQMVAITILGQKMNPFFVLYNLLCIAGKHIIIMQDEDTLQ